MKEPNFFQRVYDVVKEIPPGRVTSYGSIARFLGTAGSSRMVGWAMNAAHDQVPIIPAHRVVNRNGLLTGRAHFRPPSLMAQLLRCEGVEVQDDQVVNFKEILWDPTIELNFLRKH